MKSATPGVTFDAYATDTTHHWVLCLCPNETLSDDLEASLFEWKNEEPHDGVACYGISIPERNDHGWQRCPPEVRPVTRGLMNWVGKMLSSERCEKVLSKDLLCFHQP